MNLSIVNALIKRTQTRILYMCTKSWTHAVILCAMCIL